MTALTVTESLTFCLDAADALFMVNGCGQADWGDLQLTTSWGDGFRTEFPDRAWGRGVSSAAPFFDALLDPADPKPYARSVILSPHL